MILKKNIAFCGITKIRPVFIFTVGNQSIPHVSIASIFDQFYPIQPVFYVVILHNNGGGIKIFFVERLLLWSRNKII